VARAEDVAAVKAPAIEADCDYVVVGGGTAGCVLANRLSADPACRVVLLEAGEEATSRWIAMPAGIAKLYHHPRLNWRYRTQPEPALDNRSLYWPRGKVLGGTSSINGMTFVRGQREDYDAWAPLTGGAWSWSSVLPWFRRFEDRPFGTPELRGDAGPMRIGTIASPHPLAQAFLASANAAGIPRNDDYNGAVQEGIAFTQVMMRDGVRTSAASAYLDPVRSRANLDVRTRSLVRRVVVQDGRAIGVEVEHERRTATIRARREVLLCAGTVASPQILMLSGIGDAGALRALGIPMVANRPAVGENLQEHVRAQLVFRTRVPSYNRLARGLRLLAQVARYAVNRQGLLAVTASQVNGFVRSAPDVDRPDLQLVFRPSSGDYVGGRFVIHDFQGVMAMAGLLRPRSRGRIALASADPHDAPAIFTGHLTDAADFGPLIRGVRLLRGIFATPPIAEVIEREERPGPEAVSDDALRAYLRATADSLYHAVGTCAMGADERAVTTPDLRVRGVDALRVVDASVMPLVPSGNTAAAVLMIAERAADLISRQYV
jgi:choline dehydrogenase